MICLSTNCICYTRIKQGYRYAGADKRKEPAMTRSFTQGDNR